MIGLLQFLGYGFQWGMGNIGEILSGGKKVGAALKSSKKPPKIRRAESEAKEKLWNSSHPLQPQGLRAIMFHSCGNVASPLSGFLRLACTPGGEEGGSGVCIKFCRLPIEGEWIKPPPPPPPQHQALLAWVLHPVPQESSLLCQPVAKMFTQVVEQRSVQSSAPGSASCTHGMEGQGHPQPCRSPLKFGRFGAPRAQGRSSHMAEKCYK